MLCVAVHGKEEKKCHFGVCFEIALLSRLCVGGEKQHQYQLLLLSALYHFLVVSPLHAQTFFFSLEVLLFRRRSGRCSDWFLPLPLNWTCNPCWDPSSLCTKLTDKRGRSAPSLKIFFGVNSNKILHAVYLTSRGAFDLCWHTVINWARVFYFKYSQCI